MARWGVVPFHNRWVAEYGDWSEGAPDARACEGLAFIVAQTQEQADWVVQRMNDLAMEPRRAIGVVGRVEDGVTWLGPFEGPDWAVEWLGDDRPRFLDRDN